MATFGGRLAARSAWAVLAVVVFGAGGRGAGEVALPETSHVSLTGDVADLRPGVPAALTVSVRNDSAAPARVTSVAVTVTADGPRACDAALAVAPFRGVLDVPAGAVREVVLTALLDPAMPAACRAVTWRLDYAAS